MGSFKCLFLAFAKFVILFVFSNGGSHALRILAIYPTPSISHQVVFRKITLELLERGHQLVVITTDPIYRKGTGPKNLTEIDIHDISYSEWSKSRMTNEEKYETKNEIVSIFHAILHLFEIQMASKEVQKILNDKTQKFDLLLFEAYLSVILGFSHIFKAPVIQISSYGSGVEGYEIVGASTHPLIHPSIIHKRIYNLTAWDKLDKLYVHFCNDFLTHIIDDKIGDMLKRVFGPDVPSIDELKCNVDMLMLNIHPIWDMNRPVPANAIYMGGIHQEPREELPEDLKNYMDSSQRGVIYVSFGTNVEPSLFPSAKLNSIINALSRLPYDVLWKWNKDKFHIHTKNIRTSKWFPQANLLRHPNLKLFVTQGGLQSTDEAITAGVPMIGIPMMIDQWYNVEQYVKHGIGLHISLSSITEESFLNAVTDIINNDRYRQNIIRLRSYMLDEPMKPIDRALWWIDYVTHHGAKHLRSPSANLSFVQYYELELICYLVVVTLLLIFLIICIIKRICNIIWRQKFNLKLKNN
ncbi:hypothetical protein ACJJTC_001961 [Scirpophaga incertulas]